MKKVLLVAIFAIFGLSTVNAQGVFNGGINIGIPSGDADNVSSFVLGGELNYMFPVSEGFTLGPSVAVSHFFGKEVTVLGTTFKQDATFLPIAGAARFNVSDSFVLGGDIGYALGLDSGNDGGFYYRPVIGYKIGDTTQLNVSYSNVNVNSANWASISLGVMFGL